MGNKEGEEAMVETKNFKVLVSMMMALGCDASESKAAEMHEKVTGSKEKVRMSLR